MFFYEIPDGKIKNCPAGEEPWRKFRIFPQEINQLPKENDFMDGIYIWKNLDDNKTKISIDGQYIVTPEFIDYNQLSNLPSINGVTVKGDLTSEDLGIISEDQSEEIINDLEDVKSDVGDIKQTIIILKDGQEALEEEWEKIITELLPTYQKKLIAGTNIIISEDNVISAVQGQGSIDYTTLANKPQIGGKELVGNLDLSDLGFVDKIYVDSADESVQTYCTNRLSEKQDKLSSGDTVKINDENKLYLNLQTSRGLTFSDSGHYLSFDIDVGDNIDGGGIPNRYLHVNWDTNTLSYCGPQFYYLTQQPSSELGRNGDVCFVYKT